MRNRKKFISILAGFLAVVLTLGLLAGVLPSLVNAAPSLSELKQQEATLKEDLKAIEEKLAELEGQLSDNLDSMEAIVNQKNIIDQEIFTLYQKASNLNDQIATYNLLIADKQLELEEAETHLAELNAKNKERIRAMEEEGSLSYWSVLFKANNFADLLDRLNMVEEIAASDHRRLQEMSAVAKEVADAKASLEVERAAMQQSKKELEQSQADLEVKRAEADKLLAELVAKGAEYEALIHAAETEVGLMEDELDDVKASIKDAEYQQWLSTSTPTPPSNTGGSAGTGNTVGGLTWLIPCNYTRFSSPFGYRIHPVYGDYRFHYGVDLSAPSGTPIVATRSGVVTRAYYSSSGGYTVEIDHQDGYSSKYLHQTHYIVSAGQYVSAGQVIGYVGSTGTSTGPHLHFSILYNGEHVNPANYIRI